MGWHTKFPNTLIDRLCALSPIRMTHNGVESAGQQAPPSFLGRRREHVRQIGHFGAFGSVFR